MISSPSLVDSVLRTIGRTPLVRLQRLVSIAAILSVWPSSIFACDCVRLKPLSAGVRFEAPFIFAGRAVEIIERNEQTTTTRETSAESSVRPIDRQVIFQVSRAWRGVAQQQIEVAVEVSDCMFDFKPGLHYLVFAFKDQRGRAATSICTRTTALEQAADILKALGDPSYVVSEPREGF